MMIRRTLCLLALAASLCGEVRAQCLQKLLDAGGASSEKKAEPSAAEQKEWASAKLSEFQAKEKEFNLEKLQEELRNANLPETRADELQTALRETIRNYQVAADTLATVISRESSPKAGPVPRRADDAQVDSLREKLGKLREQAQTVATQVRLDEEFLSRQRSALQAAGKQQRRAQEEYDGADTDATRSRTAIQVKLAEAQLQEATSGSFLVSWRIYADQLHARAIQAEIRAIEQTLSASGLDSIFSEKRAVAAMQRSEKQKESVQKQMQSAQSDGKELDKAIASLEQERQGASGEAEKRQIETRLEIAREAREFAYPQRDIHLHTAKPISVRLENSEAGARQN